jgi:hypothetical protein
MNYETPEWLSASIGSQAKKEIMLTLCAVNYITRKLLLRFMSIIDYRPERITETKRN